MVNMVYQAKGTMVCQAKRDRQRTVLQKGTMICHAKQPIICHAY